MRLTFDLKFFVTVGKRKKRTYEFKRIVSKDNVKIIRKGKPRFFLPEKYKVWEAEIKRQAKLQLSSIYTPTTKNLEVSIYFHLTDKRSPDLQNLPKSFCDALNKTVWKDDRQISIIHLYRDFGYENPKVVLEIKEM